ncbi:hypothetical protein [Micromonospora sp. NPDC049282]|uniref:MmyB family transcriptional regulator n=1 Tax=Micromonospora sp. NPDC049282 TaxID=3364269 RepID=UPI003721EEAC
MRDRGTADPWFTPPRVGYSDHGPCCPGSEVYRWFTVPGERRRYPVEDHDRQSRAQVANLRAAYGSMGPRSRAGELVRALRAASAEFAELWDRHEVAQRFADHKTLIHPELGPIELDCQVPAARRARARALPGRTGFRRVNRAQER